MTDLLGFVLRRITTLLESIFVIIIIASNFFSMEVVLISILIGSG